MIFKAHRPNDGGSRHLIFILAVVRTSNLTTLHIVRLYLLSLIFQMSMALMLNFLRANRIFVPKTGKHSDELCTVYLYP
jgi:hypothetical protein